MQLQGFKHRSDWYLPTGIYRSENELVLDHIRWYPLVFRFFLLFFRWSILVWLVTEISLQSRFKPLDNSITFSSCIKFFSGTIKYFHVQNPNILYKIVSLIILRRTFWHLVSKNLSKFEQLQIPATSNPFMITYFDDCQLWKDISPTNRDCNIHGVYGCC